MFDAPDPTSFVLALLWVVCAGIRESKELHEHRGRNDQEQLNVACSCAAAQPQTSTLSSESSSSGSGSSPHNNNNNNNNNNASSSASIGSHPNAPTPKIERFALESADALDGQQQHSSPSLDSHLHVAERERLFGLRL